METLQIRVALSQHLVRSFSMALLESSHVEVILMLLVVLSLVVPLMQEQVLVHLVVLI